MQPYQLYLRPPGPVNVTTGTQHLTATSWVPRGPVRSGATVPAYFPAVLPTTCPHLSPWLLAATSLLGRIRCEAAWHGGEEKCGKAELGACKAPHPNLVGEIR